MKLFPVIVGLVLLLVACQTTTTTTMTNRISVGMTQTSVLRAVGKPFSANAADVNGATVERWIYKGTTSDSEVVFRNGRVVDFGVAKERRKE